MDAQFLRVNDDGTTSYKLVVTGLYVGTKPGRFNVRIDGLEGIIESPLPVTNIGSGSYSLPKQIRLQPGIYHISAEANADNSILELRKYNNRSEPLQLEVYEPVTVSLDDFNYFLAAAGSRVNKFDSVPVYVRFFGSADKTVKVSEDRIQAFKDGVAPIEKETGGNLTFRYTEPPSGAPIINLFYVPHSDFYKLISDTPPSLDKYAGLVFKTEFGLDGYIQRIDIVIATDSPNWPGLRSPKMLNFFTLHELINGIGLPLDQENSSLDNVLNDKSRQVHEYPLQYSRRDLTAIKIVYSPLVKPGPNQIEDRIIIIRN